MGQSLRDDSRSLHVFIENENRERDFFESALRNFIAESSQEIPKEIETERSILAGLTD